MFWVVQRVVSLVHSALHADITFLQRVTFRDIVHGVKNLARALLVELPKAIGRSLKAWLGGCYHVVKGLAHCLWFLAS